MARKDSGLATSATAVGVDAGALLGAIGLVVVSVMAVLVEVVLTVKFCSAPLTKRYSQSNPLMDSFDLDALT